MKILIIEGDPKLRALLAQEAQSSIRGCDLIAEAETSSAALAICSTFKPEMAVLDIDLPDGDGLDLIPRLREKILGLRVLVISDRVTPEIVDRCEELEIEDFADKPTVAG